MLTEREQAIYDRSSLLLGDEIMNALHELKVIIFGVGGVGSWCCEGLLRSGVTHLTIVDSDCIAPSNLNRQLEASSANVGEVKVEALRKRLLEINPDAEIIARREAFSTETAGDFDFDSYDYVVDAIDSLKDKAELILCATASKATLISSMGAALKVDPLKVQVAEFWKVDGCPLGAMLRRKFKRMKRYPSKKFLCVFDDEVLPNLGGERTPNVNGSLVHITSIFGMTICGLIVRQIYNKLKL